MAKLSLTLLGNFEAVLDQRPFTQFRTNKVQALLIYLVVEAPTVHQRDVLMELLWPGLPQKSAQVNLRQILYQLRKVIPQYEDGHEETAVSPLISDRKTIQLHPHYPVSSDVSHLTSLLKRSWQHSHSDLLTCTDCRAWLEEAIPLYQGTFLADFSLYDSNSYESWAQVKRESLRRQTLDALDTLTHIYLAEQDFQQAEQTARRQLEIDNLRENAYRQLMQILASTGRRSEAIALYEQCQSLLNDELGMSPAAKTTALSEQIKGGSLSLVTPMRQGIRGYDLGDKLGEGAFGAVYKAHQKGIGREVAIKIIHAKYANQPRFIRRFEAEAQIVARLEYPHIVPLYDYWREADGAYLVMRWLRGGSLQAALEKELFGLETAVTLITQIAGALHTAHRQGIIHRDVKPANILLDEEGNAYLTDFGIARDSNANLQLTRADELIGSPNYISPEQLLGEEVTPATDIYCLGLVLYKLLTGAQPYSTSSMAELIQKQINEPLPLIGDQRPELPASLDDIIQKATAKKAKNRFSDTLAFAEALHHAVSGSDGVTATPLQEITAVPETEIINPYKGLQAFQEQDAENFYGRNALIEQLLSRLEPRNRVFDKNPVSVFAAAQNRFLTLVGPSGSGKSSVVKAGLIPALQNGALPGSEDWFIVEMTPGSYPLEELEAALLRVAVNPPPSLLEPLQKDERGLARVLKRLLPQDRDTDHPSQLLLVIDQFEELFTLVQNEADRSRFLDNLFTALTDANSRLWVIVTLRADFYDRPLQLPRLGEWMRQRTELVLPLTVAELEQAITAPAASMGVSLEPALVSAIIADVHEQPGALPLMQYALTELFERRQGHTLTLATYEEIGGVTGALARRADDIYNRLDTPAQEATRQLFLRLITLGEGIEDTRRRVLLTELESLDSAFRNPHSAIEKFGRYRLLTFDHDPVTRGATVEVAHEALLREWPRLRGWLEESREDVRHQRLLAEAASQWEIANQDNSYLLRGSRLNAFEAWAETTTVALTENERGFLESSVSERDHRHAEEEARRQRELETAQNLAKEQARRAEEQAQSARSLRQRALFLTVASVVAVILAVAAFSFATSSTRNANLASTREAEAIVNANTAATQEAVAVDAQAEAVLQAEQAQISANLAAAAEAIAQENEETAVAAQAEALTQAEIAKFNEGQAQSLALTSGAREAFISGDVDLALALAVQSVSVEQPPAEAVRILNDVAYAYGTRLLYESEPPDAPIDFVDIFPGDPRLISQDGQTITIWDSNSREILNQFDTTNEDVLSDHLVSIPNSSYIANAYHNNEIIIWDWSTGEKVQTLPDIDISNVNNQQNRNLFGTPSGDTIVIMSDMGGSETEVDGLPEGFTLTGWDIESGEQIYRIDGARGERGQWYSTTPDSGTIFITTLRFDEAGVYTGESRLLIVDLETGEIFSESALAQFAGNNFIKSISVNPTGDQAFAVITDVRNDNASSATGIFISLPAAEVVATVPFDTLIRSARYSPDGTQMAVFVDDQSQKYFTLLDAMTGETIRDLGSRTDGHSGGVKWTSFAFTPDGKRLVSGDSDGVILVWDVETGELIQRLVGHNGKIITHVNVSPDGNTAITAGGGQLRFWDITPDANAQVFDEHDGELNVGIAISPDGTKALSTAFSYDGGEDEAILWDTSTLEVIHRLPGWFITVAFLPDGRSALLGGAHSEKELMVHWDIESGEVINEIQAMDSDIGPFVWDIAVSPDGNSFFFVTGNSDDSGIYQFDIETLTEMNSFPTSRDDDALFSVALTPDGHSVLASSSSGDVILFDLDTGEVIRRYNLGGLSVNIDISADGERFVAPLGNNGSAMLVDIASGEVIRTFNGHTDFVSNVVFTPDESQIVTSSGDGTLILWDVASGEALRTFSEHDAWVNRLALSPDGTLAYSTADDGTVIVRSIVEAPVEEILAYIADNRVLSDFTCLERKQYRILPLCDADGVVPED